MNQYLDIIRNIVISLENLDGLSSCKIHLELKSDRFKNLSDFLDYEETSEELNLNIDNIDIIVKKGD